MDRSILETDGYKFSMAEAGWPLRRETFYYSHRLGGPSVLPVDLHTFINSLSPVLTKDDRVFLERNEYAVGPGTVAAFGPTKLSISTLPKLSWFFPGEPVFSVSGPSAMVSWLEPLLLQLHYRIQVATLALTKPEKLASEVIMVSCKEQEEIVRETLDTVEAKAPLIQVRENEYFERALARVDSIVKAVGGAPDRLFEVGLRSATCREQHLTVLRACNELKVRRTSHVWGAKELNMSPVGTMGHEHVQRYGSDDAAFRAMKDRRPNRSSFLLDTFDTMRSGVPAALRVMKERPETGDSVRYDSGNKLAQYLYVVSQAQERKLDPAHILEDELDDRKTQEYERVRKVMGVAENRQFYGYGGFLVNDPNFGSLTRDNVSAAYKLCESGGRPVMKFSSTKGKESLPGRPVVWRRGSGSGPLGIVAQEGERCPEGYLVATGTPHRDWYHELGGKEWAVDLSPGTLDLKRKLREARDKAIMEVSLW